MLYEGWHAFAVNALNQVAAKGTPLFYIVYNYQYCKYTNDYLLYKHYNITLCLHYLHVLDSILLFHNRRPTAFN